MANGEGLSPEVYKQFVEWFKQARPFGWWKVPTNDKNLPVSAIYNQFYKEYQRGLPPTTKDVADMTPEEYQAYLGERVYEEAHPTTWGAVAPEGQEFFRRETGEQGFPLQRPRWDVRGVEQPEPEGFDPLAMDEFQREQVSRWGRQDELARQEAQQRQWATGMAEARLGTQAQREWEATQGVRPYEAAQYFNRWMGEQRPTQEYQEGVPKAELAKQWEQLKELSLESYAGSDRNWIQAEQLKLKQNPYTPTSTEATTTAIDQYKELEKYYEDFLKNIDKRTADPSDRAYKGDEFLESQKNWARGELSRTRDQLSEAQAQMAGGGGRFTTGTGMEGSIYYGSWGDPPPEPVGVGTPSWLSQFVPGLKGKKYIPGTGEITGEAPKGITPSGQLWARTSPSQRQRWAGYTEFAGQKPEDLVWGMQSMLPQDPRFGRTWRSASQRA